MALSPSPAPIYIPLNRRPEEERPRERLWKHGPDKMHTAELLALLIGSGTKGRSAIQVAEDLLAQREGGLSTLARASVSELARVKGLGKARSAALAAAFELARRASTQPEAMRTVHLDTVEAVAAHFRRHYGAGAPEKFVALFVNRVHRLLGEIEVSRGGTNAVVVNPQVVFKEALLRDARAVILVHNHPGGSLQPSRHDLTLTKELQEAGHLFRIPVAEHVIVGADAALGVLAEGHLPEER